MHYAIQHHITQYEFLTTTPRKKVIKQSLIRVIKGLMLVRLGKNEYAIHQGESMWIPLDCLCSLTFFPNSQIQSIDFSSRLDLNFPASSGQIKLNELLEALLNQLCQLTKVGEREAKETLVDDPYFQSVLSLVKFETLNLNPKLKLDKFSQAVSSWKPLEATNLDAQVQIALLIREAKKRALSGQKKPLIAEQLFSGNEKECDQVAALILGHTL
ncbi:hypothetical protein KP803_10745 [Vibrio sp. ZSDE26]|uniref:AraC family transcriptional regulator n=1 Tax=Vibrio amylolyticus TaxID=2847292 RepID=A0A9X2BH98_9VIBR|nr:hypothetical protein [Vibrio amylolyticus]MCK6263751.1 hypothetical protein [Vibrio amylolyticus]